MLQVQPCVLITNNLLHQNQVPLHCYHPGGYAARALSPPPLQNRKRGNFFPFDFLRFLCRLDEAVKIPVGFIRKMFI